MKLVDLWSLVDVHVPRVLFDCEKVISFVLRVIARSENHQISTASPSKEKCIRIFQTYTDTYSRFVPAIETIRIDVGECPRGCMQNK